MCDPVVDNEKKQLMRPHYLKEWMEQRNNISITDLAKETGIHKSQISRYLNHEQTPMVEAQEKFGEFFGCGRDGIFCHRREFWIRALITDRDEADIEYIKRIIKTSFEHLDLARKNAKSEGGGGGAEKP